MILLETLVPIAKMLDICLKCWTFRRNVGHFLENVGHFGCWTKCPTFCGSDTGGDLVASATAESYKFLLKSHQVVAKEVRTFFGMRFRSWHSHKPWYTIAKMLDICLKCWTFSENVGQILGEMLDIPDVGQNVQHSAWDIGGNLVVPATTESYNFLVKLI